MIAQYSGHVDFRNPNDMPKEWAAPLVLWSVLLIAVFWLPVSTR